MSSVSVRNSVYNILDSLKGRQIEVFYVLLVSSGKYTFLPELYDIFGKEATIKFLQIFAGCTFKVPSVKKLRLLARDTTIYVRLERANKAQHELIVKNLADDYNLGEDRVRVIYAKMKVHLEETLGFTALQKFNRKRKV